MTHFLDKIIPLGRSGDTEQDVMEPPVFVGESKPIDASRVATKGPLKLMLGAAIGMTRGGKGALQPKNPNAQKLNAISRLK